MDTMGRRKHGRGTKLSETLFWTLCNIFRISFSFQETGTNLRSLNTEGRFPRYLVSFFANLSFEVTQFDFVVGPLSMFAVNSMTLKGASESMIEKIYIDTKTTPDSEKVERQARVGLIVTEEIPEERTIAYLPAGNYKL